MLSMEAKEEQVCSGPRKFFIGVSPNLYLELIRYAMPMMPTIWFSLFYVQVLFHFFLASTMKKETLSTFPFRLVSYALDDQEWEEKVSSEWFSWDCTTDTWEVQWLPSSLAHLLMISMTLWTLDNDLGQKQNNHDKKLSNPDRALKVQKTYLLHKNMKLNVSLSM